MFPEETNPSPVDEANPSIREEANPDFGSQNHETMEPDVSTETESPQYTTEQIEQWRKDAEGRAETQADHTRRSQELAEVREELERTRQAQSVLMGREQQRQDPMMAIDAALEEAWDPAQRRELMSRRDAMLIERATNGAVEKALAAIDVRDAAGDADVNELARLEQRLTPAQRVAMLKREQAAQRGTLYEDMRRDVEEKEVRAQNAARLNAPLGEGAAPGMYSGGAGQSKPRINDVTYMLLTKEKQQALRDQGVEVYNNRTGETIPT